MMDSHLRMRMIAFLLILVLVAGTVLPTRETGAASAISITLGAPQQLTHPGKPDALGMRAAPDQPLTPIQQPDKSYHLFIAAGEIGGEAGSTGLISTTDFLTYKPVVGTPTKAQPVLVHSCIGSPGPVSCRNNYDANYAGVDYVFPASNGTDLLMLYQGTTANFGDTYGDHAFYSVVALASSTDQGVTWTRQGPVITGTDPKPDKNPRPGANGADQSGAIVANGYVYDFYPYFPSQPDQPDTIQVARASIADNAAPGKWTKYYNGAFDSQPGLGGLGSPVIQSTDACKRPAQPWLAFNTYLKTYVMVLVCEQGWFFSTSADLTTWSTPTQFFAAPDPEFTKGKETDENVSLVTPGNRGQEIGQTGYVLYAKATDWGKGHDLWMRPFEFVARDVIPTPRISGVPPRSTPGCPTCPR